MTCGWTACARVSPVARFTPGRAVTPAIATSHAGQGLHSDAPFDRQDPVQPGGHEQPLHLRRHAAQHQAAAAAAGPPVGTHDHPEPGGVPGVECGQIEHQVACSVVDGRVQDRTGVRRAADVEAAPDDQARAFVTELATEPLQVRGEPDEKYADVVLARVGEAAAVDEVMQEVALAAVRQQAPLADAAKVGPWLYRLALRQSLLFRRRQGRFRKLTGGYAEQVRPTEHDPRMLDPLEWLLADERAHLVRQAIGRLPRREVEILLLKYSESWSYEQLAQHLGVTESAVESRLHRARRRLRQELAVLEPTVVSKSATLLNSTGGEP